MQQGVLHLNISLSTVDDGDEEESIINKTAAQPSPRHP